MSNRANQKTATKDSTFAPLFNREAESESPATEAKPQGLRPAVQYDFAKINLFSPANNRATIQPKLEVNQPGDQYEQEADAMAEKVQGRETGEMKTSANHEWGGYVNDLPKGGQPLAGAVRDFYERRFKTDFSHVKIHTDSKAAESAQAMNAHAYTVGQNIVFGSGKFRPEKTSGKRLIAHELAHVIQQQPITSREKIDLQPSQPNSYVEQEATKISTQALFGQVPQKLPRYVAPMIARQDIDIDLEVPSPAERAELSRQGIRLPQVSLASADPRSHSDFIDRRLTAVGYGIYLGGYIVYCDGLPVPIFVPETQISFGLTNVAVADVSIYPDRTSALTAIPFGPPAQGQSLQTAFYRGAGGAVVAPTIFSPATTPRFIDTALRARRELAEQVQRELIVLAISLVGGMALRALVNRLARVGGGAPEPAQVTVPPGTGRAFGRQMAEEMRSAGYRGNPFREFMRRLNTRSQRLPPQEAAEAIATGTPEFSRTMGTAPPVQQGNVLVVASRRPGPNAPVMGIRSDGTVIMGTAPELVLVRNAQGVPVMPPQVRIIGNVIWE